MKNIQEKLSGFRKQYPQYNDLDDATLLGAFQQRYYPDMDVNTLADKIDFNYNRPSFIDRAGKSFKETALKLYGGYSLTRPGPSDVLSDITAKMLGNYATGQYDRPNAKTTSEKVADFSGKTVAELPAIFATGAVGKGVSGALGVTGIKEILLSEGISGGLYAQTNEYDNFKERIIGTLEEAATWAGLGALGHYGFKQVEKLYNKVKAGEKLTTAEAEQVQEIAGLLPERGTPDKFQPEFNRRGRAMVQKSDAAYGKQGENVIELGAGDTPEIIAQKNAIEQGFSRANELNQSVVGGEGLKKRLLNEQVRSQLNKLSETENALRPEKISNFDELVNGIKQQDYESIFNQLDRKTELNQSIVGKEGLKRRLLNEQVRGAFEKLGKTEQRLKPQSADRSAEEFINGGNTPPAPLSRGGTAYDVKLSELENEAQNFGIKLTKENGDKYSVGYLRMKVGQARKAAGLASKKRDILPLEQRVLETKIKPGKDYNAKQLREDIGFNYLSNKGVSPDDLAQTLAGEGYAVKSGDDLIEQLKFIKRTEKSATYEGAGMEAAAGLEQQFNDDIAKAGKEFGPVKGEIPETVSASELNAGDVVKHNGDVFKVAEKSGAGVRLKDGIEVELEPWDEATKIGKLEPQNTRKSTKVRTEKTAAGEQITPVELRPQAEIPKGKVRGKSEAIEGRGGVGMFASKEKAGKQESIFGGKDKITAKAQEAQGGGKVESEKVKVEKQPWEMTFDELQANKPNLSNKELNFLKQVHIDKINKALQEGKKVPDEVLVDYPELVKDVKPKTELDYADAQRYKNGILEGEMILKSGKTAAGRKMSKEELLSVKNAVENSKKKLRDAGMLESNRVVGGAVAGSAYGVEKDENGNLTYNPGKGLRGALTGAFISYAGPKVVGKIASDLKHKDVLGIVAGEFKGKENVSSGELFRKLKLAQNKIGVAEFNAFRKARGIGQKMSIKDASILLRDITNGKKFNNIGIVEAEHVIPDAVYDYPFKNSDWGGRLFDSFKQTIDEVGGSISTRLKRIDPSLKRALRTHEFKLMQQTSKDLDVVEPFVKATKKMNRKDRHVWDLARKNGDSYKIATMIDKYGLQEQYSNVRKVLDRLYADGKDVGFNFNYMKDYHPRRIKDSKGFLEHFEKTDDWSIFENAIRKKQAALGRTLTDEEKANVINSMIRGYGDKISLSKTANMKNRTIEYIDGATNQFYYDSDTALLKYVQEVNDIVAARKFFGKKEGAPVLFDDVDAKAEIEQSIGEYISHLVDSFKIKPSQEKELRDILFARFNARGAHGFIGVYKNLEYIDAMGQVSSALTQIGDLAFPVYKAGPLRAVKAYGKAIFNKSDIKVADLGINNIAHELMSDNATGKLVTKVFKIVGLEKMDQLGKETLVNSVFNKYVKMARKTPEALRSKIKNVFENETDVVLNDLKNGEITDNVKLLMFNELLDVQPVALSEMPQKYLTAGNGRIFYMLKTWTLKQLDVYRNEVFNAPNKLQAAKNLFYLTGALMLSEMAADTAKDFILGRKSSMSDKALDGLLRRVGFSKWSLWKAREEGLLTAIKYYALPPSKLFDAAYVDYINAKDGKWKGSEMIASIPLIGKPYYWWFGRGKQKTEWKKRMQNSKNRRSGRGTRSSRSGRR